MTLMQQLHALRDRWREEADELHSDEDMSEEDQAELQTLHRCADELDQIVGGKL